MSRTLGIFRWSPLESTTVRGKKHKAIEAYAASKGVWATPEMIVVEGGAQLLEAGGQLGPILRQAAAGDHVILASFADLSDSPSELLAGTAALVGLGVDAHVLEIGPLDVALPALRIAWTQGAAVEAQLIAERQHAKERDAFWADTFTEYQRSTARAMAARLGPAAFPELEMPEAVSLALPEPNGHDAGEPDFAAIGQYLRERREAAGLTQLALAARLGVDASAVSRLEKTGKGPLMLRAFETLAPEAMPGEDVQATVGLQPWYFAAWARARLTTKENTTNAD